MRNALYVCSFKWHFTLTVMNGLDNGNEQQAIK